VTRRSRLPVVVRLAEVEQRERLRALALARGAADDARRALDALERALALAVQRRVPAPGSALSVCELRANFAHAHALGLRRHASARDTAVAERREDVARDAVARVRLRVRALRRASARRAARAAVVAQRREQRRLDEAGRGLAQEDRDAPL
jgi:hypothetical protein